MLLVAILNLQYLHQPIFVSHAIKSIQLSIINYQMKKYRPRNKSQISCQICQKDALFTCGQCQTMQYCSQEHQRQHWKQEHKSQCNLIKQNLPRYLEEQAKMNKKKFDVKKNYFENYSNCIYEQCLIDAKLLIGFQRKTLNRNKTKNFNEFQYAGAVCLLVKTYILLDDRKQAQSQLSLYLRQKKQFLFDMSDVVQLNRSNKQSKQFLQNKMNLLSTIANLCYVIGRNCIQYYILYTKHIQQIFGPQSLEMSNCYFLIGCYMVEEGYFNRAIACFSNAAKLRANNAGDCYFNIGILYKLQKNFTKSLQMFEIALKLRKQHYGENQKEIAEVHQNMGMLYTQLNDFTTAMSQYQISFRIRSQNQLSPEYLNIIDLIHQLYEKLKYYIQLGQPDMKKPQIYNHLQSIIKDTKVFWPQAKEEDPIQVQRSQIYTKNSKRQSKVEQTKKKKQQLNKKQEESLISFAETLFVIPQHLLEELSPVQLFNLSQLQIQLQNCKTQYAVVNAIAISNFLKLLNQEKLQVLTQANLQLFKLIRLEIAKNQSK